MLAAVRRAPERPFLAWCEVRAERFATLGLIGLMLFYAATAAYGVTLSGRWDEVQRGGLIVANDIAVLVGLGIGKVSVSGNNHVTEAQVTDALGVKRGVSIFAFDTAAARDRLLQNGWVREARVMRFLPTTLVVEIEERSPFAIWREGGDSVVIDAAGRPLAEVQPVAFPSLPVVSGPGAASPAKEIVDMVRSFPELALRVRDIERVAGRRWDLLLDTGLRAKLPAGYPKTALADLSEIAARNPAALYEISEIDLRVDSQFTLRLKDGSEEGRKKFLSWFAKGKGGREAL
jgi:cell division protein FtsQ